MDDRYNERYRRGQAWRGYEQGGTDRDARQPESDADDWQAQRRRQRLAPGQLSDGGAARDERSYGREQRQEYGREYGRDSYPDHPSERADQRRGEYRSDLRYGLNGQYDRADEEAWRLGESYGSGNRDQEWLREVDRPYEDMRRHAARGYFSDIGGRGERGGYGNAPEGERQGHGYTMPYRGAYGNQRGDEYAGGYGGEYGRGASGGAGGGYGESGGKRGDAYGRPSRDEYGDAYHDDPRRGYRGERDDPREDFRDGGQEHGALYNLGRRIGEVVGEVFGNDSDRSDEREARREGQAPTRRMGPKGYQRSDERIREAICEQLAYARGVDVSQVGVEVTAGVATLSGIVRSRSEKYDIEDLADHVFGVTEVQNSIRVQRDGGAGVSGYGAATASKSGPANSGPATSGPTTGAAPSPGAGTSSAAVAPSGGNGSGVAASTATPARMTDLKTWTPD
ncbi:BON domain-containing protein [Cupriavidus sp. 2TAF22]|uniref:BON domain-containing protein n=1 Tax=unclassified Cupriavidus TaxID=2640874 RepID=UPI003F93779E